MTKVLVFFLLAIPAFAQAWRGYGFLSPGGRTLAGRTQSTYYVGGGFEGLLDAGVGAGVELQGVLPSENLGRGAFGIFSINGYYHPLRTRIGKLDPFATVGYSLAFRTDTANLWNFGGGMNYWFREDLALLVEFRDQVWGRGAGPTQHLWGFRFGFSFR
jgi:hypothetical protein